MAAPVLAPLLATGGEEIASGEHVGFSPVEMMAATSAIPLQQYPDTPLSVPTVIHFSFCPQFCPHGYLAVLADVKSDRAVDDDALVDCLAKGAGSISSIPSRNKLFHTHKESRTIIPKKMARYICLESITY